MSKKTKKAGFGTLPVFLTAISTILGAILFLRFGYSVGSVGLIGTVFIIIIGHLVTIPTALSLSEIATNQRVEGGGEYFIISRSFGLNIGATIGIALYLSQAISVAFYVMAFTEAFQPVFESDFLVNIFGEGEVPKQIISVPVMIGLSILMLTKGANMGVKALYIVVAILALSLICFFIGDTGYEPAIGTSIFRMPEGGLSGEFFIVFAIIFPAFTGMTAGVGLSGDLRNPSKSIPLGTTIATISGMIIYLFIAWKLAASVSLEDLKTDMSIMSKIAVYGPVIIPLGLAASTLSSALGSVMVAPRTLQALGLDGSIPIKPLNKLLAKGKGKSNEPVAATLLTCIIALIFVSYPFKSTVVDGEVFDPLNTVAAIISMFFMVTYGAICLISFLYHFGADPSYRPVFKSRWYISLIGFVFCIFLMFQINQGMAFAAIIVMVLLYLVISYLHKDRGGMQAIFLGAIFQFSRKIHIFIQRKSKENDVEKWRPSVVCVSKNSFERDKALRLLEWISNKYGFGTYIHLIEDYFSKASNKKAQDIHDRLMEISGEGSNVYIDTLISPSFTSAIAQIVQLPGISGMSNNMILFEFDRENLEDLQQVSENIALARSANLDVGVLASSSRKVNFKNGIHVWIRSIDHENSNLMILLSYIILGHQDWEKGKIKIYEVAPVEQAEKHRQKLLETIQTGRLPISPANIEVIEANEDVNIKTLICERSIDAGLTVLGFREEQVKFVNDSVFHGYSGMGDMLFVNTTNLRVID